MTHTTQFNGKLYDKIRVLGQGSFGTAVVHRRQSDCSLVVIKEIDLRKFKGENERMRALNEALIMSKLSHDNIIKYYNAYITETMLLIEMEYASIGSLANYISIQEQPLDSREILVIFRQIVLGLNYLHSQNIVHSDLKVANIFLTIEGLVKIGDFGIAQYMQKPNSSIISSSQYRSSAEREIYPKEQSRRGSFETFIRDSNLGTLAYCSPERCIGKAANFKSDVWSLGCILYELITSRPLFGGNSLLELISNIIKTNFEPIKRTDIDEDLIEIFAKTISRNPDNRPSADALASITNELLAQSQQTNKILTNKRRQQGYQFDLSTEFAIQATNYIQEEAPSLIYYPHSLVYQVRLNSNHIQVNRVNLPQTKRIKEMTKGKSHYLVLTYDSIVYGWGSRDCGQLGGCRMVNSASLASSTQTLTSAKGHLLQNHAPLDKKSIINRLKELGPTSKPFIIRELTHQKVMQVASGWNFSVFLLKNGIVMTCGDGSNGCLGHGNFESSFTPSMVEGLIGKDIIRVSSGPKHVIAVSGDGCAYSWGKNYHGRLGIGVDELMDSAIPKTKYILSPRLVKFTENVFVKNAICGDRCTVFIDSTDSCWACGENRCNKLGLDIKSRFRKTTLVAGSTVPKIIKPLRKYKIATGSIGKNHSCFISRQSKLVTIGQDIDYTYRLRNNIIRDTDTQRLISSELNSVRKRILRTTKGLSSLRDGRLVKSGTSDNLRSFDSMNDIRGSMIKLPHSSKMSSQISIPNLSSKLGTTLSSNNSFGYTNASTKKFNWLQMKTFRKKTRSIKGMSFEYVLSASAMSKFTLVLTGDNRVYFWGTRSFKDSESYFSDSCDKRKSCKECPYRIQNSIEPRLISRHSDETFNFIRIGAINENLMKNIEILGSDQPIINAQDPQMVANSLSDLWILDYRRSLSASSLSSSAESSISSTSPDSLDSSSLFSSSSDKNSDCIECSICDRICSSRNSCDSSCEFNCNLRDPKHGNIRVPLETSPQQLSLEQETSGHEFCTKFNAILEPQPIVGLYVPSTFNQKHCSLHFADLFCFEDDKFYIILDTTVMEQLQPQKQWKQSATSLKTSEVISISSSAPINRETNICSSDRLKKTKLNVVDEVAISASNSTESMNLCKDSVEIKLSQKAKGGLNIQDRSEFDINDNRLDQANAEEAYQPQRRKSEVCTTCVSAARDIPNAKDTKLTPLLQSSFTGSSKNGTPTFSSQTMGSLEEPVSMSTIVGRQVFVGPTMRSSILSNTYDNNSGVGNDINESQRMIELGAPAERISSPQDGFGVDQTNMIEGEASNLKDMFKQKLRLRGGPNKYRHRFRKSSTQSESTGTNCTTGNDDSLDPETSSMPSWVKNEFIQQQRDSATAAMLEEFETGSEPSSSLEGINGHRIAAPFNRYTFDRNPETRSENHLMIQDPYNGSKSDNRDEDLTPWESAHDINRQITSNELEAGLFDYDNRGIKCSLPAGLARSESLNLAASEPELFPDYEHETGANIVLPRRAKTYKQKPRVYKQMTAKNFLDCNLRGPSGTMQDNHSNFAIDANSNYTTCWSSPAQSQQHLVEAAGTDKASLQATNYVPDRRSSCIDRPLHQPVEKYDIHNWNRLGDEPRAYLLADFGNSEASSNMGSTSAIRTGANELALNKNHSFDRLKQNDERMFSASSVDQIKVGSSASLSSLRKSLLKLFC